MDRPNRPEPRRVQIVAGCDIKPKRPWFGPKRIGYGMVRLVGWLIVAVFVAVVTGIALWLGR